jgi:hypothetical protein
MLDIAGLCQAEAAAARRLASRREEECSFLKKRTKKLFCPGGRSTPNVNLA